MTDSDTTLSTDAKPAPPPQQPQENDAGRALLVGVLGGLVSAAGYLVYRRLPDEQRDKLHQQVRSQVESRINEIRSNLNI